MGHCNFGAVQRLNCSLCRWTLFIAKSDCTA